MATSDPPRRVPAAPQLGEGDVDATRSDRSQVALGEPLGEPGATAITASEPGVDPTLRKGERAMRLPLAAATMPIPSAVLAELKPDVELEGTELLPPPSELRETLRLKPAPAKPKQTGFEADVEAEGTELMPPLGDAPVPQVDRETRKLAPAPRSQAELEALVERERTRLLGPTESAIASQAALARPARPPRALKWLVAAVLVTVVTTAVVVWVRVSAREPSPSPAPLQPLPREVLKTAAPPPTSAAVASGPFVDDSRAAAAELPTGKLRIVTTPDTTVSVDGKKLGKQPLTVELPAGRNTLQFENAALGLKCLVRLDVAPGDNGTVKRAFAKGELRVDAPPRSRILVDGRVMGSSQVTVWEGLHKVDVVNADRSATRSSQIVEVMPGTVTQVSPRAPVDRRRRDDEPRDTGAPETRR